MPFVTLTNQAANAVNDLLLDCDQGPQNIRFIERPSQVTFALDATAITAEYEVFSGGRRIIERSQVPGAGVLGTMPNVADFGITFLAAAGEILKFQVRETGGVATTDYNLTLSVDPI